MSGFGGTIKLKGEAEYRQALQNIAAELQKVAAQQKLTAATYDKADTSLVALSRRSEDLKSKLAAQQEKVKTLTNALKDYQSQQEKNKTVLQNLETQYDKEKKKLAEIEQQYGKNSKEYEKQAKVVADLESKLKEATTQYDKNEVAIKKTQAALTSSEADIKKTTTEIEKLAETAEKAGDGTEQLGSSVRSSGREAKEAAEDGYTVFKNVLANLATQVITKVISGLKQLTQSIYESGTEFDSKMARVEAISNSTAEEMEKLTAKAKEMGQTTKFTASEASDALYYMAMAGWRSEEMLEGIGPVMDLAAASGEGLARTSDIVTDALTAMGYKAGDAGKLADVMAAAAANANTTVDMMGSTFKYVGAVVGSLGYSMEDTAVSIALMANSGIKAEMAGTALRSMMTRLATNTSGAADEAKKLGVEITNSDGSMRSWGTVINELREGFKGLSQEEQNQVAKTISGTRAMNGFLAIMNATEADMNQVTKAIENSNGAAKRMAETMLNNVGGKMTMLKRQIETGFLAVWEKVEPTIAKTIDKIRAAVSKIDWQEFGEKASKALQTMVDGFEWVVQNRGIIITAISAIVAAFATAKIVDFGKTLISTFGTIKEVVTGLWSTIAAHPILALVGAIAALGIALDAMNDKTTETQKYLEESRKSLKETRDSWNDLKQAQQDAVNKGLSEIAHYEALIDELEGIVDANGRVQEGYEGRASFITSTLANALGIEISYQDGLIEGYDTIRSKILDLIESKKAEIILNSQEAAYTEALQNRGKIITEITELTQKSGEIGAKWSQAQMDLANATTEEEKKNAIERKELAMQEAEAIQQQIDSRKAMLQEYYYNISTYEENAAKFHEGKYDEMTQVTWDYVKEFENAANAEEQVQRKKVADATTAYNTLEELSKQAGSNITQAQIDEAKKQLDVEKKKLSDMLSTTKNELNNNQKTWLENAATTISKLSEKKVEFRKTGEGMVQMYVDGIAQGKPMAEKQAEKITRSVISEFDEKSAAEGAGRDTISGFINGVGNFSLQNTAFGIARRFGNSILENLKNSLGIGSPSKYTKQYGRWLLEGLGIGMEDEETTILKQAEDFGTNLLETLNAPLEQGLSTNALNALKTAIPAELSTDMTVNTSRMAEAAQTREFGLVAQFKEALGEMKVEMDDREMGKFVDKTVSELVYN